MKNVEMLVHLVVTQVVMVLLVADIGHDPLVRYNDDKKVLKI